MKNEAIVMQGQVDPVAIVNESTFRCKTINKIKIKYGFFSINMDLVSSCNYKLPFHLF